MEKFTNSFAQAISYVSKVDSVINALTVLINDPWYKPYSLDLVGQLKRMQEIRNDILQVDVLAQGFQQCIEETIPEDITIAEGIVEEAKELKHKQERFEMRIEQVVDLMDFPGDEERKRGN